MNFMMSNSALVHSRAMGDAAWDSTKFTLTKGYHPLKSSGDGVSSEQMHIPGAKLTHFTNMQSSAAKGFPTSKSSVADVSNPGVFLLKSPSAVALLEKGYCLEGFCLLQR